MRYYCNIRLDVAFKAGMLPLQVVSELNNRIENAIEEWSKEMTEKSVTTDIGWNWSEHKNM